MINQNAIPEIRERRDFSKVGTLGWVGLAGYVIAWDIFAPETLSAAADRALEHRAMKYVAWGLGGAVTAHVLNLVNPKYDPIQRTADYIGDLYGRAKTRNQ